MYVQSLKSSSLNSTKRYKFFEFFEVSCILIQRTKSIIQFCTRFPKGICEAKTPMRITRLTDYDLSLVILHVKLGKGTSISYIKFSKEYELIFPPMRVLYVTLRHIAQSNLLCTCTSTVKKCLKKKTFL